MEGIELRRLAPKLEHAEPREGISYDLSREKWLIETLGRGVTPGVYRAWKPTLEEAVRTYKTILAARPKLDQTGHGSTEH